MANWIGQNLIFPDSLKSGQGEAKVQVRFVVGINGEVGQAEVVRSSDPAFNAEALRLVRSMPAWKPAIDIDGEPVPMVSVLPLTFRP